MCLLRHGLELLKVGLIFPTSMASGASRLWALGFRGFRGWGCRVLGLGCRWGC